MPVVFLRSGSGIEEVNNSESFSQHTHNLLSRQYRLYKMLHVAPRNGHHQARINKMEGSQITFIVICM
jgi:hypothetical protein